MFKILLDDFPKNNLYSESFSLGGVEKNDEFRFRFDRPNYRKSESHTATASER